MFRKILSSTLGDIKNPYARLTIILLLIAVVGLSTIIATKDREGHTSDVETISYLRGQNAILKVEIDSLNVQIYIVKSESNKKVIEVLQGIINTQNELKLKIRKNNKK